MNSEKKVKSKGLIRWEAILPITFIILGVWAYFFFLFDLHLRKTLEWAGYNIIGAEVDIQSLETSFLKASIKISGIELTNSEQPKFNVVEVGQIRFSMLWDALLRGKVVINEAVIEQISYNTLRKRPGKLKPPEPEPEDKGPGVIEKEAAKLKEEALNKAKQQENVLGDLANIVSGGSTEIQMSKLEGTLKSKELAKNIDNEIKEKQKSWQEKLKNLPQGKDIQALGERANKVKIKDFKSPEELQNSIKELEAIFKEADAKVKQVQQTQSELSQDLNKINTEVKSLDEAIKLDKKNLEAHFKIPSLDSKTISEALFKRYLNPYLGKINHYRNLAAKYIPPKYMAKIENVGKKDKSEKEAKEIPIQARPRDKGITYEFGQMNSYPLFWLKRAAISSQAGVSENAGNISGEILNITSNQRVIGKPTEINISGDFPGAQVKDVKANLVVDGRKDESLITTNMFVGSYPIQDKMFVESDDIKIGLNKAQGQFSLKSTLTALKNLELKLDNKFSQVDYNIAAKSNEVQTLFKNIFSQIPLITLEAEASGAVSSLETRIVSNLGGEIEKGFNREVQGKINEARSKIQKYIDDEVGKLKSQIDGEVNKMRMQVESEVNKAKTQLEQQKKQSEAKVDQAKKDSESQVKKKLEHEGQKAVDELKKKFGF